MKALSNTSTSFLHVSNLVNAINDESKATSVVVTSAKALVTEMRDVRDDGDDEKGETIRQLLHKTT